MLMRYRPRPQIGQEFEIPAPVGGVNAISGLANMPPLDSIIGYNLIPDQYGLHVRTGWREWVTNITGTGGVRTIMPANGLPEDDSDDDLFAAAASGIWRVTSSSSSPTQVVTFGIGGASAGWCSWTNFTTVATSFLLVCDEANGYYTYDPSPGTWTQVPSGGGGITNVNPANLVFVTQFKGRVWFIERNSARAWYLAPGTVVGAATVFDFGNKFKYGGPLIGLYPWTIDGGDGSDDYLVAISQGGDVVIYRGTDPASAATWDLKGSWYIGDVPAGRRPAEKFGGDLLILSTFGALTVSSLLSGTFKLGDPESYVTAKITPIIKTEMSKSRTFRGWEIRVVPSENILLIASPKLGGQDYFQFAQSLTVNGWGVYRSLPYQTGEFYKGLFYIGTADGRVIVHTADVDAVNLAGSVFTPIDWSLLTSFQNLGSPGKNKQIGLIRPVFVSMSAPIYTCNIKYDYKIEELPIPPGTPTSPSSWDNGQWDISTWGGAFAVTQSTQGASGMGKVVAVVLRGKSTSDTTLVGFQGVSTFGGFM